MSSSKLKYIYFWYSTIFVLYVFLIPPLICTTIRHQCLLMVQVILFICLNAMLRSITLYAGLHFFYCILPCYEENYSFLFLRFKLFTFKIFVYSFFVYAYNFSIFCREHAATRKPGNTGYCCNCIVMLSLWFFPILVTQVTTSRKAFWDDWGGKRRICRRSFRRFPNLPVKSALKIGGSDGIRMIIKLFSFYWKFSGNFWSVFYCVSVPFLCFC